MLKFIKGKKKLELKTHSCMCFSIQVQGYSSLFKDLAWKGLKLISW